MSLVEASIGQRQRGGIPGDGERAIIESAIGGPLSTLELADLRALGGRQFLAQYVTHEQAQYLLKGQESGNGEYDRLVALLRESREKIVRGVY